MLFLDTESCGLVGPTVLIQYSIDDAKPILHEVFYEPVSKTLRLLEMFCDHTICGFNLTHDWFHIVKLYNLLRGISDKSKPPTVNEILSKHNQQSTRYCLRPKSALDLFLYARKGPYQTLMSRDDVKIKKVPIILAHPLAELLKKNIPFDPIYFARGTEGYTWKVEPHKNDPQFANVTLRFKASSGLKVLSSHIFKRNYSDFPMEKKYYPTEYMYDPYNTQWKDRIEYHIEFWHSNKTARGYAETDVELLQRLWDYWLRPSGGDDDSVLACAIGAARWRGFEIDRDSIASRIEEKWKDLSVPVNVNSHYDTLKYLHQKCSVLERLSIKNTEMRTLERIAKWKGEVGERARQVIKARKSYKEIGYLQKLSACGRFCPNFKIIGTRSGRMSGGSDFAAGKSSINPQGVQRDSSFRRLFKLHADGNTLSGGDFEGFEVTLADAAYNDPTLRKELMTGKSAHALFGEILYDKPYDEIMASKGTDHNWYNPAKNSFFALIYGSQAHKLSETASITKAHAEAAYEAFLEKYPKIREARSHIFDMFCSMRQPNGIGTKVEWHTPADYVESLLGYRRYYTLENRLCYALFELANKPPKEFDVAGKIIRRSKEQSIKGAAQSALYACAFNIQASNMRSAANHVIQSTGAEICKNLQRRIWDQQPVGVSPWVVQTLNVHDEVMVVHENELDLGNIVEECLDSYRDIVPLIKMDWKRDLKDWSGK